MRATPRGFGFPPPVARLFLALVALAAMRPASVQAQQLQDQTSIVVAFVTDTAGRPLSGAEVQVVGTSLRGSTDDAGRVVLVAVPTGKAVLRIRRLGFSELSIPISVTPGVSRDARYQLKSVAADLKKVVVRASALKPERYARTGRFDDFYRRRSQGLGTFLTREIIDARNAQKSEDLLRMVTGVRVRYRGNTPSVQFLRCETVNVYIDGIRSHDPFRDYFSLSPLDIEAIEVYHGIATVPPEFSPNPNDCAAIVVWTRWHG
ncbi:MAG: carboxypeptidase-like regulatory domain-containing protein [Gemmatimonadaceae bacterium]|nr:carboxypeptidase-like regulatory domain-containing protein [Gemmatimonadaceae bacterium]